MNLCTHFSFLYCQCVLVTSWKLLQGASFVLFTNFAVQLSHLIHSSFFWFVPRWCTLLSEIKFLSSFNIKFFKSGYKTLSLLPACCPLSCIITLSILCQLSLTNPEYIRAQPRLMRFGADNSDLSSFARCRLWTWRSLLILLFRDLWGQETSLSLFDSCLFCLVRRL